MSDPSTVPVDQIIYRSLEKCGYTRPSDSMYKTCFTFLADNELFGCDYVAGEDGGLLVSEAGGREMGPRLETFIAHMGETKEQKLAFLRRQVISVAPETVERLDKLIDSTDSRRLMEDTYVLYDFFASHLDRELHLIDNAGLSRLATDLCEHGTRKAVQQLAFLAAWSKATYHDAQYSIDIRPMKRFTTTVVEAYSFDTICYLYYHLLNEDYIREKEMFLIACDYPDFARAWLYFTTHMLCSLRDTDLIRLLRPTVNDPDAVLYAVSTDTLTDEEAVKALDESLAYLRLHYRPPHKVRATANVPDLSFTIPPDLAPLYGRLCLVCESHRQKEGLPEDAALILDLKDYWSIRKVMGPALAKPFRERNACPTAFSKSFMQGIAIVAKEVGGGTPSDNAALGYKIASLARSHKGSYGSFPRTTETYLKDNALCGLTGARTVYEMLDRGSLSYIKSLFLLLLTNGGYQRLAFTQQSALTRDLGLSNMQIENVMKLVLEARSRAKNTLAEVFLREDRAGAIRGYLDALEHSQGTGSVLCFLDAVEAVPGVVGDESRRSKVSCDRGSHFCISCPYRLDVMTLVHDYVGEYYRLLERINEDQDPWGQKKSHAILNNYLLPALDEVYQLVKNKWGEAAREKLDELVNGFLGNDLEKYMEAEHDD